MDGLGLVQGRLGGGLGLFGGWFGDGLGMVGGRFEFVVGAWRFVRGMRGHSFQVELGRSTRTFGICLLWFGDALGLVRRRPGGGLGLFWGWLGGLGAV